MLVRTQEGTSQGMAGHGKGCLFLLSYNKPSLACGALS